MAQAKSDWSPGCGMILFVLLLIGTLIALLDPKDKRSPHERHIEREVQQRQQDAAEGMDQLKDEMEVQRRLRNDQPTE